MAESHREEIAKLEALYAGNPGGRVFVHLAEAYRKAGEHERARRILDEGLARHTDSASGYVVLGRVLADMQITAEAEVAFRRVLELDGGNLVALRWLGDLARQAGRNAEAASHYRELLVRNPSNEEVRDLVEIVERSDPAARPADEDASPITDWADPSAVDTGASEDTAVAEPISSFEEAAVTPPHATEPGPADITPWSAAPGHTDDVTEAPVEYGVVEIDALPGDALHLDQADEPASPTEQFPQDRMPAMETAEPPRPEPDTDLVATWDSENADVLELDELSRDDEAEPMEIHLLDPAFEGSEEDTAELDVALDLTDLSDLDSGEDAGEYADDEFIADLASVPQDEMDGDDYAPPGADFTLLPDEPKVEADSAEAGPDLAAQAGDVVVDGPYDIVADEPFDVPADEPYDVAADEPFELLAEEESEEASASYSGEEVQADASAERAMAELAGAAEPAAEASDIVDSDDAIEVSDAAETGAPAARDATRPEAVTGLETGLVTETMAVLYRTQGFHDRAAEVYRALLRSRPGDERLTARLKEAEEAAGTTSSPSEPEDEAGEVWLRGVGAAWTAAGTEGAENATPYAWTDAPEEVESGAPISDYLRELVAWKGGQARWSEAAPQEPAAPPARGTDADASPPDWLVGGDDDALPWADAAVEEVASWSPAQLPEEDTPSWRPEPEPESAAAAPDGDDDLPADPWLQGMPAAGDAVFEPLDAVFEPLDAAFEPLDAAGEEPASTPAAEDDSGAGWTPFELDRDIPAAAPAASGPAEVPPPAVSMSADDDPAEDEDLEMFRSWLQSLKK